MDNINFNNILKTENIQKVFGVFTEFAEKNTSALNHKVNFGFNNPQMANTKVL